MTEEQRKQAIKFQDAIGAVVDQFIREGMSVDLMKEVIRDEVAHFGIRKEFLEHGL